jgi:hypothetical protein
MTYALSASLFAVGLFLGMLILLEVGRLVGIRRMAQDPDGARAGLGAVEGAVFGLLGLLVAFTFAGAISRFDTRRQLIVEETNHIGTAYLRVDLLPGATQPAVRELFRKYLDSRLETYRRLPDLAAAKEELGRSMKLQGEIWRQAVTASRSQDAHPDAAKLLVPALNAMIDITTTRTMAGEVHPPAIIFVMLFGLAFASSLLAGYGMASSKTRSWVHMLMFALATAGAVYVILDIEYPRLGLIRVDAFDRALVELRESMK